MSSFEADPLDEEQWRALLDDGGWEPVRIEDGIVEAQCKS